MFVTPHIRRLHCANGKSHCLGWDFWLYSKGHHTASHFEKLYSFILVFFYKKEKPLFHSIACLWITVLKNLIWQPKYKIPVPPVSKYWSRAQGEMWKDNVLLIYFTCRSSFPYSYFLSLHIFFCLISFCILTCCSLLILCTTLKNPKDKEKAIFLSKCGQCPYSLH